MKEEKNWYVVATRSRAEKKVSEAFAKIGVEHYLPVQKQLRQWKDRKKWVDVVLFNSYIFVRMTDNERNIVFEVSGVIKYLSVKGKICTLPEEEIERIEKICNNQNDLIISNELLLEGDSVEIVKGPLKGIRGKVIERTNGVFLNILLENLGYTASFKIDGSAVKKI